MGIHVISKTSSTIKKYSRNKNTVMNLNTNYVVTSTCTLHYLSQMHILFCVPSSTVLTKAVNRPIKHPSKKEPIKIPMKVPTDVMRLTTSNSFLLYPSTDLRK